MGKARYASPTLGRLEIMSFLQRLINSFFKIVKKFVKIIIILLAIGTLIGCAVLCLPLTLCGILYFLLFGVTKPLAN